MQPWYLGCMDEHAMTLRLPGDLYEELRREAYEERTNKTAVIIEALNEHFDRRNGNRAKEEK